MTTCACSSVRFIRSPTHGARIRGRPDRARRRLSHVDLVARVPRVRTTVRIRPWMRHTGVHDHRSGHPHARRRPRRPGDGPNSGCDRRSRLCSAAPPAHRRHAKRFVVVGLLSAEHVPYDDVERLSSGINGISLQLRTGQHVVTGLVPEFRWLRVPGRTPRAQRVMREMAEHAARATEGRNAASFLPRPGTKPEGVERWRCGLLACAFAFVAVLMLLSAQR